MPKLPALDLNSKVNDSPHVVILGAGASNAVCPRGDLHGKRLPLMNNLISSVGLAATLQQAGFQSDCANNFEQFYSKLVASGDHESLRREIEFKIQQYFDTLMIPKEVTIYDYLLLSLRPKRSEDHTS